MPSLNPTDKGGTWQHISGRLSKMLLRPLPCPPKLTKWASFSTRNSVVAPVVSL